jgi:hypothetical protein
MVRPRCLKAAAAVLWRFVIFHFSVAGLRPILVRLSRVLNPIYRTPPLHELFYLSRISSG